MTMVANTALAILALVTGMLAARILGPTGRGALAAIQIWPTFIAVIAMLGLPEAVVFFSSRDSDNAGQYLVTAIIIALLVSIPFLLVSYFLLPLLLSAQSLEIITAARWYLLIIPLYASVGMLLHPLRGRNDLLAWNILRLVTPIGWLFVIIVAISLNKKTPQWLASNYLIFLGILFLPLLLIIRRRIPGPFRPNRIFGKPMLKYGLPSMAGTVPQFLNLRMDQMLLAALFPAGELGLYVVGVAWSGALAPLLTAIGAVGFPQIAAKRTDYAQKELLASTIRISLVFALFLALITLAVTPIAVPLLFGSRFSPAIPAALILVVAAAISNFNIILEEGIRGYGQPKHILLAELCGLLITAISLLIFLRPLRIMGAALASLLGYSITTVVMMAKISHATGYPLSSLIWPNKCDINILVQKLVSIIHT